MTDGSDSTQLMRGVKRLCLAMAAAGVLCFLFTLLWGFEWRNLWGFLVGTAYACGCMRWLAGASQRAVRSMNTAKAKRIMRGCYAARMSILVLLCAAAMLSGLMSPVGIIVPQLFPRILLSGARFAGRDFFTDNKKTTGKDR
ncbi:MAG: hypothetical protein IJ746_08035 [Ruminococcus sp.]|nr:hypothetical protein [Ruminococcus sp.]